MCYTWIMIDSVSEVGTAVEATNPEISAFVQRMKERYAKKQAEQRDLEHPVNQVSVPPTEERRGIYVL